MVLLFYDDRHILAVSLSWQFFTLTTKSQNVAFVSNAGFAYESHAAYIHFFHLFYLFIELFSSLFKCINGALCTYACQSERLALQEAIFLDSGVRDGRTVGVDNHPLDLSAKRGTS